MNTKRALRHLSLIFLCCAAVACKSLPNMDELQSGLDPKAVPSIASAKGKTWSIRNTRALLGKRWARSPDLQTQAALEEAATGVPLIAGNKVSLLFDGPQTMAEMIKAIGEAKNNINLETYIFDQDPMGIKFADMLIEKQKAGVTVNVIYDSVGTIGVPQQFFDRMRDAGIHLVAFNPINPVKVRGDEWKVNNRDHRKVLIVDGKMAFTGGINISDTYAKSSLFRSKSRTRDASQVGWRDTHVKIEGPAAAAFQWMFVKAWVNQDAADLTDAEYFPPLNPVGDKLVRVIATDPGGGYEIYKAYLLAIQQAKKSVHITSAYFVPDDQTIKALTDAAKRGVDVKVVLPSVSDSGLVFHAGRHFYDLLLDNGVKIYELKVAVLHAKTAVVDATWATVGSTNMDRRSFMHNSELNVVVLGDEFGTQMENAFTEDIKDSQEITREGWHQRPLTDHVKEWAAHVWGYWL